MQIAFEVLIIGMQIVVMPYIIDRPLIFGCYKLADGAGFRNRERTDLRCKAIALFGELIFVVDKEMPGTALPQIDFS